MSPAAWARSTARWSPIAAAIAALKRGLAADPSDASIVAQYVQLLSEPDPASPASRPAWMASMSANREKVGEGARRSEKVGEGGRRWEMHTPGWPR